MIKIDDITDKYFDVVIESYEKRIQHRSPDFKLSDFEKMMMKTGLLHGYEYAHFQLQTESQIPERR